MTVLFALIRAAHIASLMVAWGGGAYLFLIREVHDALPKAERLRLLFACAACIALVTAILSLALAADQMSGDWSAAPDMQSVQIVVVDTLYGHVFLARVALIAALCLASGLGFHSVQAPFAGAALAALALTSHAAAGGSLLLATNDAVHLVCGGFWIGGLCVLGLMLRERKAGLPQALPVFSLWGTYAVGALAVAGTINALAILQGAPARWSPAYMTILAIKIVLAAVMIALALANRFRLTPAICEGSATAPQTLAWNVIVELVIGAAIITLAAFLGLLPPSRG